MWFPLTIFGMTVFLIYLKSKRERGLIVSEEKVLFQIQKVRHKFKVILWSLPGAGGIWLTGMLALELSKGFGVLKFTIFTLTLWGTWFLWLRSTERSKSVKSRYIISTIIVGLGVTLWDKISIALLMWGLWTVIGSGISISALLFHLSEGRVGTGNALKLGLLFPLTSFTSGPVISYLFYTKGPYISGVSFSIESFTTEFLEVAAISEGDLLQFFRALLLSFSGILMGITLIKAARELINSWRLQRQGDKALLMPYLWFFIAIGIFALSTAGWLCGYFGWTALFIATFAPPLLSLYLLWLEYSDLPPQQPKPLSRWWFIFTGIVPYLGLYVILALPSILPKF